MGLTALIPARGGSKRIPRKNLVDLGGKPLVAWTIEAALEAADRTIVSTEDREIAAVSREWGAEVLDRPVELAEDHVPTRDVTLHAIEALDLHGRVALLHPTSPFRSSRWIDEAMRRHRRNTRLEADRNVVSFTDDELNGAIYLSWATDLRFYTGGSFFINTGSIEVLNMPLPDGLDIDTPEDLERAREHLMATV